MSLKGNYLFLKITQGSDKKTQPFGGLEPQLASIKSPNKKACVYVRCTYVSIYTAPEKLIPIHCMLFLGRLKKFGMLLVVSMYGVVSQA